MVNSDVTYCLLKSSKMCVTSIVLFSFDVIIVHVIIFRVDIMLTNQIGDSGNVYNIVNFVFKPSIKVEI